MATKGRRVNLADLAGQPGVEGARVPPKPATASRAVRLDRLAPNPLNARDVHARSEKLAELAASLQEFGQIEDCTVVSPDAFVAVFPELADAAEGALYVQVSGGRRLAAAAMAGLAELNVAVKDRLAASRAVFIAATLAENADRDDLDPIEEARQVDLLVKETGSQTVAAEQLHRSGGWVSQRLNLLKLVDEVQAAVRAGDIPVREVRGLHLSTPAEQIAALQRWRAAQAQRERRDESGQKPASTRRSRAATRVQWLREDYEPTAAAIRAELPPDEVRAVAQRAQAFAAALLRDLDG